MLSKTFSAMIIISFVSALFTGNLEKMSNAFATSLVSVTELALTLAISMCFWQGFMNVLKNVGAIDLISRLLKPLIKLIYGDVDNETADNISASVSANFLGLGNAALPLGIRAMKSFEKHNESCVASNNSVMFAVLNTVPFQLVPTTLIALRSRYGSESPFDVLPAIWVSSVFINVFAVAVCKLLSKGRSK